MNVISLNHTTSRHSRFVTRAGWGVALLLVLIRGGQSLMAQETLPPAPNPYVSLGIPPGPYSSGVGNIASGAPDEPIPGFVNGQVNPLILGWAAEITSYAPANPSAIDSYWKNLDTVLRPASGNVFDVVSLGDLSAADITKGMAPGSLTVKFAQPVGDGPGPDLVLFGNAFQLAHSTRVFAKLAYVEVSTNGVVFARFPSVDTNPRPSGAGWPYITSDARKIYNLFGKAVNAYGPSWGNPFDLRDLAGHPLVQSGAVDLQNILYVRLVAIPGSGSYQDSFGNPIYCPWPTYGSPGPEIQAVGYLNLGHPKVEATPAVTSHAKAPSVLDSPAPVAQASPWRLNLVAPKVATSSLGGSPFYFAPVGTNAPPSTETFAATTETAFDDSADSATGDSDPQEAEAVAAILALKAQGPAAFGTKPPVGLPLLGPVVPNYPNSGLAAYDDQSLRPSGIQARINSYGPTLWGKTVQRVAYITGWEPTPGALTVIILGGGAMLLLAIHWWLRFRGAAHRPSSDVRSQK